MDRVGRGKTGLSKRASRTGMNREGLKGRADQKKEQRGRAGQGRAE